MLGDVTVVSAGPLDGRWQHTCAGLVLNTEQSAAQAIRRIEFWH